MKKIIIGAAFVGVAFVLYCCIRVGAQEDRWLEMNGQDKKHEGRKNG